MSKDWIKLLEGNDYEFTTLRRKRLFAHPISEYSKL